MTKIYSLTLNHFVVDNGVDAKYYFKSNGYQIHIKEGRITIYDRSNHGTINVVKNLDWQDIRDFEGNSFLNETDARRYLINCIHQATVDHYNVKDLEIVRLMNAGNSNMNVNGSVTPVEFVYSSPQDLILTRLEVFIGKDAIFTTDNFADLPELVNGCLFTLAGVPRALWKTNRDVALSGQIASTDFLSNQNRNLLVYTDLRGLFLPRNEEIKLLIQDDLSTLQFFYFTVNGYKVND